MPINAGPEYFKAEEKYSKAKTKEEKIEAMEEMIRTLPKHKGTENMLGQLKRKLAKLKKEKTTQAKTKPKFVIKKEGAAQVCIIGMTNSGKSKLLQSLTNAKVEVGDYEYTTKNPAMGMMDYEGVNIQMIEIPSTFNPDVMSIVRTCDLILILLDSVRNLEDQLRDITEVMENKRMDSKKVIIVANKSDLHRHENVIQVSAKKGEGLDRLKREVWSRLELIRVYTKSPGKPKAAKPITLSNESTIRDATREVHKTILKDFKFARIFNNTKHSGQKVGLDYKLSDLDVIEIHTG